MRAILVGLAALDPPYICDPQQQSAAGATARTRTGSGRASPPARLQALQPSYRLLLQRSGGPPGGHLVINAGDAGLAVGLGRLATDEKVLCLVRPRLAQGNAPGRQGRGGDRRVSRRLLSRGQPVSRQRGRGVALEGAVGLHGPVMGQERRRRLAQQRRVHRLEIVDRRRHARARDAAAAADRPVAKRHKRRAELIAAGLRATDPSQRGTAPVGDRNGRVHGEERESGQLHRIGALGGGGARPGGQRRHNEPAYHSRGHGPTLMARCSRTCGSSTDQS